MKGAAMRYIPILFLIPIISSCASSSGVFQVGPDTYTISTGGVLTGSISGNRTKAKRKGLEEANLFCSKMEKYILVSNTSMQSTGFGSTSDIIFKCLDKDDPEYKRPNYEKEADIKIENK